MLDTSLQFFFIKNKKSRKEIGRHLNQKNCRLFTISYYIQEDSNSRLWKGEGTTNMARYESLFNSTVQVLFLFPAKSKPLLLQFTSLYSTRCGLECQHIPWAFNHKNFCHLIITMFPIVSIIWLLSYFTLQEHPSEILRAIQHFKIPNSEC